MVYTEPPTRILGEGIGVEAWNTDLVENIKALYALITPTPPGVIVPYGGSTAPTGWLICDGSAINRNTYSALFQVLAGTFGAGDGTTTFNLPDLRGRLPLGRDNMGGSSANRVTATQADNVGQGSGAETHTLTIAEMPAHDHALKAATSSSGANADIFAGNQTGAAAGQMQGGGTAHNNMPPYITLNYLIKI